jgi:beta-phosphoglucomutase
VATGFRGAIFDVDGVLVDSPHERAWRDALKELMETQWSDVQPHTSYSPERFTPQVYQQVMSGKPRFSGAQAALEYFDVPDAETRSRTYGDRKQSMVIELIEAGEFTAYPDALRFIIAVKDAGIHVAAASSSKRGPLPAPDPPGHLRTREGSGVRAGDTRADPPRVLRRRHLGP